MKILAFVLAAFFFIIGLLYGLGSINFLTKSGTLHAHHVSHLVVAWILSLLCLVWARFQDAPARH